MKGHARVVSACVVAAAALMAGGAEAQITGTPAPDARERAVVELLKAGRDPLANAFFTPEAVMRHQQAIGLTTDQRAAIVSAISAAQPRFIEAQWQLEPETAALAELLRGPQVDEEAVLGQIDRVLDIERQIKRIQVEMLVRIKNQLTAEQQDQLARLGGARGLGLGYGSGHEYVGPSVVSDPFRGILGGDLLHYALPAMGVPWGG